MSVLRIGGKVREVVGHKAVMPKAEYFDLHRDYRLRNERGYYAMGTENGGTVLHPVVFAEELDPRDQVEPHSVLDVAEKVGL